MNDLARLFSFGDLLGLAEHYAEFNQRYRESLRARSCSSPARSRRVRGP